MIQRKIYTSVKASGQIGVWRCTQLDFSTSDETVLEDMASEEESFQPELHDFFVVEVNQGNGCIIVMCTINECSN